MNGVDSRDGESFDSPIRGPGENGVTWRQQAALFAREPFDILA
jgi:hypothetical protein